jgi:hypothetical protein
MAWRAWPGGNCGAHFLKQAFRVPGATIAGSPFGSVTTCGCLPGAVVVARVVVFSPGAVAVAPGLVTPSGAVIDGTLAEVLVPLSPPPQAARVSTDAAAAIASPIRIWAI